MKKIFALVLALALVLCAAAMAEDAIKIGVIGPTRMKYGKITSVIEYLTDNLNNAFTLPGGQNDTEE